MPDAFAARRNPLISYQMEVYNPSTSAWEHLPEATIIATEREFDMSKRAVVLRHTVVIRETEMQAQDGQVFPPQEPTTPGYPPAMAAIEAVPVPNAVGLPANPAVLVVDVRDEQHEN